MTRVLARDLPRTIYTQFPNSTRRIEHGTSRHHHIARGLMWVCKCGRSFAVHHQNAMARKSKLEKVYNDHMRAMLDLATKQGCPQ